VAALACGAPQPGVLPAVLLLLLVLLLHVL
jgi:hypothetical protein